MKEQGKKLKNNNKIITYNNNNAKFNKYIFTKSKNIVLIFGKIKLYTKFY